MATLTKGKTFGATEEVTAAKLHQLVDSGTITHIVAADIDDSVITNAKIDSVAGNKLTGLTLIPSGSGIIPVANIDTGTTANKIVKLTASAKLPVCSGLGANDGSEITGLNGTNIASGTVPAARLGSGTPSSSNFLRGDNTWGTDINTSNVIFSWTKEGTTESGYQYSDDSYSTFLRFRFVKIAGISTVYGYARIKTDMTGWFKVDIGGQNQEVSTTSGSFTWVTLPDINVSGLTNGTAYDGICQLKAVGLNADVYCSTVTLIAS
jgi:hypothetical protein